MPLFKKAWPLFLILLWGCSGGGTPSANNCGSQPTLSLAGYSTSSNPEVAGLPQNGSGPYPSIATFLYFSSQGGPATGLQPFLSVTGTPNLKGSDGSAITAGPLSAIEVNNTPAPVLMGYYASISGLKPNVTYSVSFASFQSVQPSCQYGGRSAGSFVTN